MIYGGDRSTMGKDKAPKEYLDAIRAALKANTDGWTDVQLDDYAYGTGGGWDHYFEYGFSAADAVSEDVNHWDDTE